MQTINSEFAPLEVERATELEEIISRSGKEKSAVVIDPDEQGVSGTRPADLISSLDHLNGLVRYQRHYCRSGNPPAAEAP